MATLEQIFQYTIGVVGEVKRQFGDRANTANLTVVGPTFDTGNIVIADNFGAKVLWQTDQGGMTSFEYLVFLSDKDVILEFANTAPNPDERALFTVKANALCVIPSSVMGGYASNTTRLDGASMVAGTDFNTITEIRVQRNASDLSGDATVRLMLVQ